MNALKSRPLALLERMVRNVRGGTVVVGSPTRKEVVVVNTSLGEKGAVVVVKRLRPGDRAIRR